jgi:hypothetical protein
MMTTLSGCIRCVVRLAVSDEGITDTMPDATPAAPAIQTSSPGPEVQAPFGPITRARARELSFIMLLRNEGPEDGKPKS